MIDQQHIDLLSLIPGDFKRQAQTNGGEYAGACPFCGGDDRFRIWPNETPNPGWWCRQCDKKGDAITFVREYHNLDYAEALDRLDLQTDDSAPSSRRDRVSTPTQASPSHETTKREYLNMQDYAEAHGLDAEDLQVAGWEEVKHDNRRALRFSTPGGTRYRFLDGNDPRYKSEYGFKTTWYGLGEKVIANAKEKRSPLFICNGEISAIAARWWGVPAICLAGGGERKIPTQQLQELNQLWDGRIGIVMDCDEKGRRAARQVSEQLPKSEVIDLGGDDGYDLADFCRKWGSRALIELKRMMPVPVNQPVTHREAAQRTIDRLDPRNVMDGKPIIIPLTLLHQFGGYAKFGWPGKLSGFVGMSGHGKTSMLNSIIDELVKRGETGVGVMPEFDADEYHWDRIQRYSGHKPDEPFITAEKMMSWEMWKKEAQMGVPEHQRSGDALTEAEQRIVHRISLKTKNWPGTFELFPYGSSINETLRDLGESILNRRAAGELVTFAAFDYVQILRVDDEDGNDNSHEQVLNALKHFCMRYCVHGLVTSQVNKDADRSARSSNKLLGTQDMRYVRDAKFNLLVTLNLRYDEGLNGADPQKVKVPGTPYYAGIANVAKNNKGRVGAVNLMADFKHLRWLDRTWNSASISLDDERSMNEQISAQNGNRDEYDFNLRNL